MLLLRRQLLGLLTFRMGYIIGGLCDRIVWNVIKWAVFYHEVEVTARLLLNLLLCRLSTGQTCSFVSKERAFCPDLFLQDVLLDLRNCLILHLRRWTYHQLSNIVPLLTLLLVFPFLLFFKAKLPLLRGLVLACISIAISYPARRRTICHGHRIAVFALLAKLLIQ